MPEDRLNTANKVIDLILGGHAVYLGRKRQQIMEAMHSKMGKEHGVAN